MELKKDHLLVKKIKPLVKQICHLIEAYQTLQTTNMNFETLLGWQVFKNGKCSSFQSSSLSIRASFCIWCVIHTFF